MMGIDPFTKLNGMIMARKCGSRLFDRCFRKLVLEKREARFSTACRMFLVRYCTMNTSITSPKVSRMRFKKLTHSTGIPKPLNNWNDHSLMALVDLEIC